jgi:hypothetical protein
VGTWRTCSESTRGRSNKQYEKHDLRKKKQKSIFTDKHQKMDVKIPKAGIVHSHITEKDFKKNKG